MRVYKHAEFAMVAVPKKYHAANGRVLHQRYMRIRPGSKFITVHTSASIRCDTSPLASFRNVRPEKRPEIILGIVGDEIAHVAIARPLHQCASLPYTTRMPIKRSRKLTVMLSEGESANLDKLAHLAGLNVSDYLRTLLLREWKRRDTTAAAAD